MNDYEQPDFYRFSEDSIKLSRLARKYCEEGKALRVLDLGAGCGVVGLELASQLNSEIHITFCELQKEYLPQLKLNCENLAKQQSCFSYQIMNCDWGQISEMQFDFIVSNPPYFLSSDGRASANPRTNIARRWDKDEEDAFFKTSLRLSHSKTVMVFSLRRDVPDFFKQETQVLERQIFHSREDVLTFGIVFRLNIETDKRF